MNAEQTQAMCEAMVAPTDGITNMELFSCLLTLIADRLLEAPPDSYELLLAVLHEVLGDVAAMRGVCVEGLAIN